MIRLTAVTKRFPGMAAAAVDALSLAVPAGRITVLIGPSGCGKTTVLRMINRLLPPTSGRIEVDGRDVAELDPVALRRSIGYVIQQVGLFPHLTIAENVATVPRLLGWPPRQVGARVDEMLALVGMDSAIYRDRYPRALSSGQGQRVGVARALAGDPPLMLMDEPFGALDPVTRGRLQDEFRRILRAIGKTVVFVTHDIDEAVKLADRIVILREGRLVQSGTPAAVLASPADAFVAEFVGADRALKRLGLVPIAGIAEPLKPGVPAPAVAISPQATCRDALALMLASNVTEVSVPDGTGTGGTVRLAAILAIAAHPPAPEP